MKTSVSFSGGEDLARALGKLSTRLSRNVRREALREAAAPMRDLMEDLSPYRPGPGVHLRETMVISNAAGEDEREVVIAVGPSKAGFWGSFQELADEYGGVHHAARPFARPAFDRTWQKSLTIISEALWRELAGRGIQRSMATVETSVSAPMGGGLL